MGPPQLSSFKLLRRFRYTRRSHMPTGLCKTRHMHIQRVSYRERLTSPPSSSSRSMRQSARSPPRRVALRTSLAGQHPPTHPSSVSRYTPVSASRSTLAISNSCTQTHPAVRVHTKLQICGLAVVTQADVARHPWRFASAVRAGSVLAGRVLAVRNVMNKVGQLAHAAGKGERVRHQRAVREA